jgi:hypothetical protein
MEGHSGWLFSIDDAGRPRRFVVAEPELIRAKQLVLRHVADGNLVQWREMLEMEERLFTGMEMKRGSIEEWPAEHERIAPAGH